MFKKDYSVQFKAAGDDGGRIVAYAATFDREPDSSGDVIAPGAFKNTLEDWKESGNVIPLLFGHRTDDPSMNIGGVDAIKEDERGLRIEATFDKDSDTAQYVRRLVLEKRLSKLSFAYDVLDQGTIVLDDGREANELREIKLYEISLVPIPANGHAEVVEAKSADDSDDDDNPSRVDDVVSDGAGDFESFSDAIASIKAALSDLYDSVFKFVSDISELLETIDIEDVKAALTDASNDDADDVDDNGDVEASDDESDDGSSNRSEDNAEDSDTSNAEDPDGVDDPDDDDSDDDDDRKKEVAEAIVKMAKYIY